MCVRGPEWSRSGRCSMNGQVPDESQPSADWAVIQFLDDDHRPAEHRIHGSESGIHPTIWWNPHGSRNSSSGVP